MTDIQADPELIAKWEIEYKKGFAKPLILYLLSNGDNYPYKITKDISTLSEGQISIATSNIYLLLRDLKDQKLIIDRKTTDSRRVFYRLTENGYACLEQIVESLGMFLTVLTRIKNKMEVESHLEKT
ncbi:MAG: PadR family transcriptional regulator [Candidatus Hodarchaeales archaeon]|jgi:DNA-binding PadR family transcriptional regulator